MQVSWIALKSLINLKGNLQYVEDNENIYIFWVDGVLGLSCTIIKNLNLEDKEDFENNYKSLANKNLWQLDDDGAQIVRLKAAKRGWSFWSIPIEITTSTLSGTLFCQDSAGTNIPWVSCKIYNSNDEEITTAGLLNANLNTCVKTIIDFEPTFNFEVIGGSLRINSNPSQDVRLWIVAAPDIPAPVGSKEFASGINLKFLAADNSWQVDGRVTKAVTYDPIYHSGKLRLILKHPAGLAVNMMFVVELYRQ